MFSNTKTTLDKVNKKGTNEHDSLATDQVSVFLNMDTKKDRVNENQYDGTIENM